jgi:hypothetical protein
MVMRQRGGTKQNQKEMLNVFSICIFSIRREVNSWNLHLQKLRGLCKYLANVCNSHSHVYRLHRLTFAHKQSRKKRNEASRPFKRAQRYLDIKYGEVSLQIESAELPPKPQPLYEMKMKRRLDKQGKCGQTNSTWYNTQG